MTEASTGLRKALARNAGVSTLSPEELLAQMSDEQKASLAATLAPTANAAAPAAAAGDKSKPEMEEGDDDDAEMGEGKKKPKDKEYAADDKAETETQRAVAVMSSEHFKGREAQAAKLLGNAKLSSSEIVALLADMSPATTADPEAAALAEMQAALKENAPSGIEANSLGAPTQAAGDIWEKSYAKLGIITKPAA